MARAFVLAHCLGDDILCALNGIGSRLHLTLNKSFGSFLGALLTSQHDECGKRFESLFTSHLSLSAALGFEWQIDVLECLGIVTFGDSLLEFGSHLPLLGDSLADSILALFHLAPFCSQITYGGYLHLVERTGALFAIAGDKWNSAPLVEEFDSILYAAL